MSKKQDITRIVYRDFPFATVTGYFNGDMFEDWLNCSDKNDPYRELKKFFIIRDEQIYQQALDKIKEQLNSSVDKKWTQEQADRSYNWNEDVGDK